MTSRLYISNFSTSHVTSCDISELVSKLCPVIDIYIPTATITGIDRGFAIVVIDGDIDLCRKCVKTFNACYWKGYKIRVEIAKIYYQDRLKLEKQQLQHLELVKQAKDLEIQKQFKENKQNLNCFSKTYVNVRKRRDGSIVKISTDPSFQSKLKTFLGCKRKVYDIDDESNDDLLDNDIPKVNQKSIAVGSRKGFGTLNVTQIHSNIPLERINDEKNCEECDVRGIVETLHNTRKFAESDVESDATTEFPLNPIDMKDLQFKENERLSLSEETNRYMNMFKNLRNQPNVIDSLVTNDVVKLPLLAKSSSIIVPRYDPLRAESIKYELSSEEDTTNISNDDSIHVKASTEVNLESLKSIFHREGGVWFGDDGTLAEAVVKGEDFQDSFFMEAEKLGIDIRTKGVEDPSKMMKFSFFDEETLENLSNTNIINSKTKDVTLVNIGSNFNSGEFPDVDVNASKSQQEADEYAFYNKVLNLSNVASYAKLFSTSKSDDIVRKDWNESREKLILSCKQKRREVSTNSLF